MSQPLYRIVGFNDIPVKPHGDMWVHFKDEDCFDTEALPTEKELREYATKKGYLPRPKPPGIGISKTLCQPVYRGGPRYGTRPAKSPEEAKP